MKKLQEEKAAILKEVDGRELTKKELNALGINDYYIKIFMGSDIISRISRGNYKVSFTKNEKISNSQKLFQYFNRFKFKVLAGKYVEAYESLMENYKMQTSHDYDNHMRIYFILLKELIGDKYDFSPLEELYEFTEKTNATYYDYYVNFREAIMAGNFYNAKMYLEKFTLEEKKSKGLNNISTILFNNLLDDVLKKIENSYNTQVNHNTFQENYRNLVGAIVNQDYKNALKYVETCIFNSKTEKMTLMMKKFRMILNDIIAIREDNISITPTRINYSKTNSLYFKFEWALEGRDYYKAQELIEEILTVDNRGRYKVMKKLIDAVINAMRDRNVKSQVNQEALRKMNSPLDSAMAYRIFLNEFEAGNYENALYNLEISMLKDKDSLHKNNNEKICNLLKSLIDMEKNKHGFIEVDVDYSNCANDIGEFNKALENGDYKTAFRNSGRITYRSTSKMLSLFKELLNKMYELDKRYGGVKTNTSNKIGKETKTENNLLTEDLLTAYVDEGKYEELFTLLQEKKQTLSLNRLEHTVFKLIKIYNSVVKGYYEVPNHVYTLNEKDCLGRFFEAIRCEDIYTAYGEIASIYGNVKNPHEFEIFETILKDIIDKKEEKEEENNVKVTEELILKDISNVIREKQELSSDDLENLYGFVSELQYYGNQELVYIISNILEFIEMANNQEIDATYLADLNEKATLRDGEEVSFYDSNKENDVMFYLQNGDYISALRNIKYLSTKDFTVHERSILKNLLVILNNTLNNKKEYKVEYGIIPEKHIENIRKFIKKYDFFAAFNYIIDNNLNDNYISEIFPFVFDSMTLMLIMHEEIYKEFVSYMEQGDFDQARIAMINYKERLDNSSLSNSEYSQEKYAEMKKLLQR